MESSKVKDLVLNEDSDNIERKLQVDLGIGDLDGVNKSVSS